MDVLRTTWLCRFHLPEVMEIERTSFDMPWTERELMRVLRGKKVVGRVVVGLDDAVRGFYVVDLQRRWIDLLNIAVHPDYRRRGIGTIMVENLASKINPLHPRLGVATNVSDKNLTGHLFFRALGFRATGVIQDAYDEIPGDAYHFELRVKSAAHRDPLLRG